MGAIVEQSFYARDALIVAEAVLGKLLRHGGVVLRITEVEAYRHPDDSANHCRAGRTARNAPMWGPPGHAYVYLCYGMHHMLNLVTDGEGQGAAVLVRAAEPVRGHALVRERRGGRDGPIALTGPGKVAAALGLDTSFSGHSLFRRGGLSVVEADPPAAILAGPRVGIAYARPRDQRAPWRLAVADSDYVSHPKTLRRLRGGRTC
jgi:DNA-3-methyladenine glycosylase